MFPEVEIFKESPTAYRYNLFYSFGIICGSMVNTVLVLHVATMPVFSHTAWIIQVHKINITNRQFLWLKIRPVRYTVTLDLSSNDTMSLGLEATLFMHLGLFFSQM